MVWSGTEIGYDPTRANSMNSPLKNSFYAKMFEPQVKRAILSSVLPEVEVASLLPNMVHCFPIISPYLQDDG